ncbi:MAG: hypothetical protein H0U80_02795 [Solirubrobacterales bacterium]|nr:hypothetical protein [Solirubrobacterales bacterium]
MSWRSHAENQAGVLMDDRRAHNHERDRQTVLDLIPSMQSWSPAVTTEELLKTVHLPRHRVLMLLHELHADGLAVEAGGRWRRSRGV